MDKAVSIYIMLDRLYQYRLGNVGWANRYRQ